MSKSKRTKLSNGVRFEVFKRDSFRCQYCGRSAPDVILECDHIIPVASGGTNDLINLVTSCRDCNRGKGKREISDKTALSLQKEQLEDLNEMRIQAEMMIEWKKELMCILDKQVDAIDDYLFSVSGWRANDSGRRDIKKLLNRFGFAEVSTAFDISFDRYFEGDSKTWNYAFHKVGGVCYNRRRRTEEGAE